LLLENSTLTPGIQQNVLLTVQDVARMLAVSTATVYGLCNSGELRHVRVLNLIRVRPEDLREFVATTVVSSARS
jgi:excisionase family DNA binding protein